MDLILIIDLDWQHRIIVLYEEKYYISTFLQCSPLNVQRVDIGGPVKISNSFFYCLYMLHVSFYLIYKYK